GSDGADHRRRGRESGKDEHRDQRRHIRAARQSTKRRALSVVDEIATGNRGDDPDVVVRTRLHAIETQRAIEVADFARQEQFELTPSLVRTAADAVVRRATGTRLGLAHLHLERRDERLHEVKLTDWADVLAEARAAKQGVDGKSP